ncbi:MAG: hypothetical protein P8184_03535 [Calditrichia bacterium]
MKARSKSPGFRMVSIWLANLVVAVGIILLIRVFYHAAAGALVFRHFHQMEIAWFHHIYAVALSIPVPFHVISVGLVLRKRWLSPLWQRIARVAVVVSGCWLGAALGVKMFVL